MTDDAGSPAPQAGPQAAPRATPDAEGAAPVTDHATPGDADDVALLALIDRLAGLLDRSDLTELEVGSGGTGIILRKPSAVAPPPVAAGPPPSGSEVPAAAPPGGAPSSAAGPDRPSVKAPLTGIFYASPAPGSAPYVQVGGELAVGQVIGLIEAMKLFNEIKSDLAGRVVRVVPESGTLVKAKQPLIEVEPL